jgi:hypothetical protein
MAEADLCLRPSEEQRLFEELNDFDFDYFNAITVLPYPAGLNMGVLPKIPIDFSAPYTPMRTYFSTDSKDDGPINNSNIDCAAIDGNRIPAATAEGYPISEDYMWRNKLPGDIRGQSSFQRLPPSAPADSLSPSCSVRSCPTSTRYYRNMRGWI